MAVGRKYAKEPLAKIAPPRLPRVLVRKRLFARLDRARRRPLVWVRAPAGFGKTTLVASYLSERGVPHIWDQLDESDGDLASFFRYVREAVGRASRSRRPLPWLTPEYLAAPQTFTARFIEGIFARLSPASVVVLDNYHDVPVDAPLHGMLATATQSVPPGCNLIVISRHEPPAEFIRAQANTLMDSIGPDALALTESESRALVRLRRNSRPRAPPAADTIRQLHIQLRGWVAGLVLLLERVEPGCAWPRDLSSEHLAGIFQYFATEVFLKVSPATQDFLLRAALLPTIDGKMAKELSGHAEGARILAALARDHFFVSQRALAQRQYEFHPPFRDFLLAQGAQAQCCGADCA